MELKVNGENRAVPEGTTAAKLLDLLGIEAARVVVEVNLSILKRAQLAEVVLKEGDLVEVVHFVGGG
jgi:thiamine biosynthesis protein ThiS